MSHQAVKRNRAKPPRSKLLPDNDDKMLNLRIKKEEKHI